MVLKLYRAGLTNNQNSLASVGKETRIQYILTSLWLKAVIDIVPIFCSNLESIYQKRKSEWKFKH